MERKPVGGQPIEMAAGRAGVWVRTAVGDRGRVARVGGGPAVNVGGVGLGGRYFTNLLSVGDEPWALAGDGTILLVGA